jgi:CRP-like cAMP-binding protein
MSTDERYIGLLEELVAWTRLSARSGFIDLLKQSVNDPRHLKAYELSDGTRTQKEVADACGISQPTVSGLYAKWKRLGIVRDRGGRTSHLVRPSDLGIEFEDSDPSLGESRRRAKK